MFPICVINTHLVSCAARLLCDIRYCCADDLLFSKFWSFCWSEGKGGDTLVSGSELIVARRKVTRKAAFHDSWYSWLDVFVMWKTRKYHYQINRGGGINLLRHVFEVSEMCIMGLWTLQYQAIIKWSWLRHVRTCIGRASKFVRSVRACTYIWRSYGRAYCV